jgi:hypothetical protein
MVTTILRAVLLDPRIFNIAIIVLFAMATVRWAIDGNLKQTLYWAGALLINVAVTFLKD